MALSFKHLLEIAESESVFNNLDRERKNGGFRWKGPHFSVLVRYVLKVHSYYNNERFSDLLMRVEESAQLCFKTRDSLSRDELLKMMESFLPELGEFFAVPRLQQPPSDTNPRRNEVVAAFVSFLVEVVEAFLGQKFLSRFITAQINLLLHELKSLLIILGETSFQSTDLEAEETDKKLAEIESKANEAGLLVHSSFFTTDLVKNHKIAASISDLLPKFKTTEGKITNHCIALSDPPSDAQQQRKALSFKYVLQIVESETVFDNLVQERRKGGFRWKGPHFPVFLRYALKVRFYRNHRRLSDLLRTVEKSAYLCCKTKDFSKPKINSVKFLEAMTTFLTNLGEFFTVPMPQQPFCDTTPKRNELVAAFIDFLVEAIEAFLGQKFLSHFITAQINPLLEDLKFLLIILGDTQFQCTKVEETDNILEEIESIANRAGVFLHSFLFTTDLVKDPKIAEAISYLLPRFKMTTEKIKKHCIGFSNSPSLTTPTGDTQRERMALSFKYLSEIVESKTLFQDLDKERKKGGFRWKGPHFSVFLRYVSNLLFYDNHERFSDLLMKVEESAYIFCKTKDFTRQHEFLEMMKSFLPELGEFFTVPRPQLLSDTTPKTNELVAAFTDFLVEAVEEYLDQEHLSCFITARIAAQIECLLEDLKFLLFIIGDSPFRCAEVEETKNILAEIKSIADDAGLFLHSFFFTTDLVKDPKIAASISDLLHKFKMLKEKIKKHCIAFSNLPGVTTPNTTLVSVFIVDSVLDYLTHLINNEVRLITRAKDQITILCQELRLSRSFLGDMEVMQDEDLIKQAIQLRDLAYDVEYILAWFVTGEVPVWYIILRLSNFIQMNQLIRNAIPKTKMNDGINKQQVVQGPHQVSSQVSNSTLIDEEIIVGLNDETMEIASQLNGGPDHLQMIFITGMPGLGKTTLAKKVYDYLSRFNHFDQRLWCVASQTCQRKRLLIDLLCCMTKRKEDEFLDMEDSDLGQYLYKRLIGRRYLIVMDDIWDMQAWNDVKIYFPKDNTRSKVLFTTRITNLASEASCDAIIKELHLLSADQCWDLLRQKVFGKSLCPPELEQIGMKIAASCKGLPLVVVGIAAVLANMEKNNFNSWQEVLGNLTSYISKNQDILELSYKHLPIHLKPCFLYFSAFKEDMEIPVKKLLSLWISEGFIRQDEDKRFEDIAEKYLIELINRNMVQVGKRRSDKRVKACRVHDLMHEMALRIAEQEKFVKVIKDGFSLYEQHNRLCNHSYSGEIESRPFGLHIRSLLGIPVSSFNESRLRLVKVLQTEDMKDQIETLRVQLRYLEIPYMLSQTICTSIKNLEFLIVTQQRYIGPAFSYMPKLRHLEFRRSPRFTDHKEFLENDCLETLSGVELRYSNDEDTLKCFPNLRRLKCSYESPWNHGPDVSFLCRLESLSMIFYTSEVNFREIKFADNIKKLSLCRASFEIMSSIGRLPNLEILKLISLDFEGQNWNTNDYEFQKLKLLKLSHLKLKNWMITSEDHFPMLEQLVLENCKHLKGIPSKFSDIQTLQMIEVHSCCKSVGESALEIQKTQQEEYGNEELQVIING